MSAMNLMKKRPLALSTLPVLLRFPSRLFLKYDRDKNEEFLSGPSDLADTFLDVADALGIDTNHLINCVIIAIFPYVSAQAMPFPQ